MGGDQGVVGVEGGWVVRSRVVRSRGGWVKGWWDLVHVDLVYKCSL